MKFKQKVSELIDALYSENAELHRHMRERDAKIEKLEAELFYLRGQKQLAVSSEMIEGK